MKTVKEKAREIPVLYEADVVVVGGGPAGIGAALASSRIGARTVIIERFNCLGGLQTQGNNPTFTFVDPELHGGIITEIIDRLEKGGAVKNLNDLASYERGRFKKGVIAAVGAENLPKRLVETEVGYWGRWGVSFDIEYYKFLLDNMMKEAKVRLFLHAFASGAIREGNTLKGVLLETKEGRGVVLGKVIIDTTGEGDIAWKSGAPVMGDEGFPVGPRKGALGGMLNAFFIGGVDMKKYRAFQEANMPEWGEMYVGRKIIAKAKEEGAYIKGEAVILAPTFDVYNGGRIYVMNPIYRVQKGKNCLMTEVLTDCEIDLRKQAWAVHKVVKENVPGFENSYIERTPNLPCIGNGHRILGEHIVTIAEMREGKAHDDGVAINNMPPDLYEAVGRFAYDILPHDVPYRALISKGIDNLLAAGTTMSSGEFSKTALRYCTPSICTGQAAGVAAALSANQNISPKKLDIKLLQDALRKQGARVTIKEVSEEVLAPYRVIRKLGIKFQRGDIKELPVTEEEIGRY
ncbi:MAG: FAD-dependent oxidoreductase [Dehalococcoidia bacterium]